MTNALHPLRAWRWRFVNSGIPVLLAKTASVELEILPAPPFPGATGRASIVDRTLPAGSVVTDAGTRQIAITGAEAKLQAVTASTLNSVFNQPAPEPPPSSNFVVGDQFGTFSLLAQAQ